MAWSFYWVDPDDASIQLGDIAASKVMKFSGLGHMPVEHFLQGVPSQHRQLHRGMKFRPRIVQLSIVDRQATAAAQDTRHTTLLAAFNPDRGEGTLKIILNDGSTDRRLNCYVQELDFLSTDRPCIAANQIYMVRFSARDPFLYDPTQNSESDNFSGASNVDIAVSNSGHIGAYPTIVVAAGAENPKIELVSTGEYIEFESYTVPGGENLTIDCWAGTVKLDAGTSKLSELKKESTLFFLPRGADTVRLTAAAGTTALCTVTWYDRYLGI